MGSANEQTDELIRGIRQGGEVAGLRDLLEIFDKHAEAAALRASKTWFFKRHARHTEACFRLAADYVRIAIHNYRATVPPG